MAVTDSPACTELPVVDPPAAGHPRVASIDFRTLCESELGYVWTTLRRLGVLHADLPDLTQEVLLVVHRQLPTYDRERPLRPWLFGIAYNTARRYRALARHRREVLSDDLPDAPAGTSTPDAALERSSDRALVRAALERLSLPLRSVLVLSALDGVATPEIARTLDIPLNTAYSRLRRAREEFAAAVRELRPNTPEGA